MFRISTTPKNISLQFGSLEKWSRMDQLMFRISTTPRNIRLRFGSLEKRSIRGLSTGRIAICPQKELTILQLISDDVVNDFLDRFGIFLYCLSHNNCIFVRDNYDKLTVRTGTKNNICVG